MKLINIKNLFDKMIHWWCKLIYLVSLMGLEEIVRKRWCNDIHFSPQKAKCSREENSLWGEKCRLISRINYLWARKLFHVMLKSSCGDLILNVDDCRRFSTPQIPAPWKVQREGKTNTKKSPNLKIKKIFIFIFMYIGCKLTIFIKKLS